MIYFYSNDNTERTSWTMPEMADFLREIEPTLDFSDRELEMWVEYFVKLNILEVVWDEEGSPNYRLTPYGRIVSRSVKEKTDE
jgi:hypothetical protein